MEERNTSLFDTPFISLLFIDVTQTNLPYPHNSEWCNGLVGDTATPHCLTLMDLFWMTLKIFILFTVVINDYDNGGEDSDINDTFHNE